MAKPPYNYIWHFDSRPLVGGQAAPKLIGTNGTGAIFSDGIGKDIEPDMSSYTYVNVSRHFSWTLNNERDEVPRVILKEMVQDQTALLTRAKYFLGQSTEIGTALGVAFNDVMDAYTGLYEVDDTGFYYDIPSLQGDYLKTGPNSFQAGADASGMVKSAGNNIAQMFGGAKSKKGRAVAGITSLLADAPDAIGQFREAFTAAGGGYYTEQPKFYQHGQNARSYQVQFPLYNTGDYDDMVRNFQLAFMLVYQNLPNRDSKQIIMPPCIYEVTFPGVTYCPYAYMSSVDVQFLGSRREIPLAIPFDDIDEFKNIQVTVPEAYMITLNIQELVGNTKNFMYFNVDRLVTTGVENVDAATESVSPLPEPME